MKGSVSVSRPQSRNHSSPGPRLSSLKEQPTTLGKATGTARVATTGHGVQHADLTHLRPQGPAQRWTKQAPVTTHSGLKDANMLTNAFSRLEVFLSYILRPEVGGCSQSPKTPHTATRSLGVTEEKSSPFSSGPGFAAWVSPSLISGCVHEHLCVFKLTKGTTVTEIDWSCLFF